MRIGVFDSGLGGLLVAEALMRQLPQYDYLYLGDTKRVPYGNRSQETIYEFVREAVNYLFGQGCGVIILACNTASAKALRRIQQEYLPAAYPDRRVLGVIRPTAEVAAEGGRRVGVLATSSTVSSGAYRIELQKLSPETEVFHQAAPLLVPLIENDGRQWASPIVSHYLAELTQYSIDTVILGCTHYSAYADLIQAVLPVGVRLVRQDELMGAKLHDYLQRHPELEGRLSKNGLRSFQVTELTPWYGELVGKFAGEAVEVEVVGY